MRHLFSIATAAAVALGSAVSADTWRMAHKMPAESIEGQIFQAVADRIQEKTGGEIEFEVFPSEQLGKDAEILEQLQFGTVHMYPEGSTYLSKWVPEIKFVSAPFVFEDRAHWARFMETDLVQGWMAKIEKEAGIVVLGNPSTMVRGPYRVMVSTKPVGSLGDISGMKLRMHPDELAAAAWRHLGAEVRTLAWTEVYESIGRGIVDAVNSPISLVEPMKFFEVAPNITRHDEYPQGLAFMMNAKAWNALSDDSKAVLLESYNEVAGEFAAKMDAIASDSLEKMKATGVTYNDVDTGPFVKRMQEFYAELDAKGELPEGFLAAVEASR